MAYIKKKLWGWVGKQQELAEEAPTGFANEPSAAAEVSGGEARCPWAVTVASAELTSPKLLFFLSPPSKESWGTAKHKAQACHEALTAQRQHLHASLGDFCIPAWSWARFLVTYMGTILQSGQPETWQNFSFTEAFSLFRLFFLSSQAEYARGKHKWEICLLNCVNKSYCVTCHLSLCIESKWWEN